MTREQNRPEAGKLDCLEALRGLAAVAVVFWHLVFAFWPGYNSRGGPQWEAAPPWHRAVIRYGFRYLSDGQIAVSIFFVLSGVVLSLSYFRGSRSLSSAAVRRYPRLMIPVLVTVVFTFLLMRSGSMATQEAGRFMEQEQGFVEAPTAPSGQSYAWLRSHFNFRPSFRGAIEEGVVGVFARFPRYDPELWTMPTELMGSFLVFASLAIFGHLRNRWLLYIVGGSFLHYTYQPHLLEFVFGMALSDAATWNRRTENRSLPLALGIALFAAGWLLVRWQPLAAALMVGAILATSGLQRALGDPRLAWLGRASFGLYLIHTPILGSLGCRVYLILRQQCTLPHDAAGLIACAATFATALAGALAFNRFVDGPTLAITKKLDAWLFRPSEAPRPVSAEPLRRAA